MQAGETERLGEEGLSPLEFSINPERVAPLLRRLVTPTRTRGRGSTTARALLLLDSRSLYSRGDILRFDLPPDRRMKMRRSSSGPGRPCASCSAATNRPLLEDIGPPNGKALPEVQQALGGDCGANVVRVNERGETIVSVAVPIQRFRSVRGVAPPVDPGRRHRRDHRLGALLAAAGLPRRGARHDHPVPVPRGRHRRAGAAARRGGRARALGDEVAAGNPRLHDAVGRDRPSFRGAARHDARALQPDRRDRELRRGRRPRAEKPPDLLAQRGRDAAARQEGRTRGSGSCRSSSTT